MAVIRVLMRRRHLNAKAISMVSLAIVECGKHRGKRKSFPFSVWQQAGSASVLTSPACLGGPRRGAI